jgi:hypothetical protein
MSSLSTSYGEIVITGEKNIEEMSFCRKRRQYKIAKVNNNEIIQSR